VFWGEKKRRERERKEKCFSSPYTTGFSVRLIECYMMDEMFQKVDWGDSLIMSFMFDSIV
jgi:hypothetical protein